ncbi:MAG: cbb3-type cytochrome c oxidase subunit I [Anaerolineae bacterium]|nr:cbb3-type cytochrome c oxidase subunit I [Anaerolineae bacterium]
MHLLTVGWLTQLIIGVAYWMFPKYSKARPRGSERLGWATYALLNLGLALRAAGEPLMAAQPGANAGWLLAASAVLQMLAAWAFVANTWARVKSR